MTLAEIKHILTEKKLITFELPNGDLVPSHFHVTEIGKIEKKFIDCGGVLREESKASFQLWEADDYNHRLHPEKLVEIINLSEEILNLEENAIIEVEYQAETIGKYDLKYDGNHFLLVNKFTSCLAEDQCGITEKPKRSLKELSAQAATDCKPGSGCC